MNLTWVQKLDPARVLADELRGKRGVESRIGVLAGAPGVDADRVEYFRCTQIFFLPTLPLPIISPPSSVSKIVSVK